MCLHVVPNQESTQGLVGCLVLCDHKSVQFIWTSLPCKCCADFTQVGLKFDRLFVCCHRPLCRSLHYSKESFYSLSCSVCRPWSPARILRFVVVCLHVVPNQESTQGLVGCLVLCDHKSVQSIWTSLPCKFNVSVLKVKTANKRQSTKGYHG